MLHYFTQKFEQESNQRIAAAKQVLRLEAQQKRELKQWDKLVEKIQKAASNLDPQSEFFKEARKTIVNIFLDCEKGKAEAEFKESTKQKEDSNYTPREIAKFEESLALLGGYELEEKYKLELEKEKLELERLELEKEKLELISRSKVAPNSNEFFTWQPTSNPAIAQYFNVSKGVAQVTYFAGNNKGRLIALEDKLTAWLPGLSCAIRNAKRFSEYKYELKVRGLSDDDLGWLTGLDISKPLTSQLIFDFYTFKGKYERYYPDSQLTGQKFELCCSLEDKPADPDKDKKIEYIANSFGVPPLKVALDMHLSPLAIVTTKRSSQTKVYQVLGFEKGEKVKVVDLDDNRVRSILIRNLDRLSDLPTKYKFWIKDCKDDLDITWQEISIYYRRELNNCLSKSDFARLKEAAKNTVSHNGIDYLEVMRWVYNRLSETEKTRVKQLCDKKAA